ncbi:MAG TPA: DUF72 domain-containing protein, partial [Acetobacteraceae bacterium]|nr:DUF72 domain-containing protein [Acetobacteraceae bacterium]
MKRWCSASAARSRNCRAGRASPSPEDSSPWEAGMARIGTVRIGISGWTYPPWRGVFYPKGLPQKRELDYAAGQFRTLEINGTFY